MRTPQKYEPLATPSRPKTVIFFLALALMGMGAARIASAQNYSLSHDYDISGIRFSETDPAVAVNPNVPTNIFVVGLTGATNGLFTTFSTNINTWTTGLVAQTGTNLNPVAGSTNLVPAYAEPSVAWDVNSNLFLAYIPSNYQGIAIAVSTNLGKSFFALTNLVTNDVTDQPRIAAGVGYTSNGMVCANIWLVYKDYSLLSNGLTTPLVAQGLQTTNIGLTGIGAFTPQMVIPNSASGGFSDIAVGPNNQVMVACQNNITSSSTSSVYVNVNTNTLLTNGFGSRVTVTSDAVGGSTYIPAVPTANGVNAGVGIGWDSNPASPYYGRTYLVYTAVGSGGVPAMNICTRYSTNSGGKWSSEMQVNDDSDTNSHFFPRISVDPITGSIGYVWCDCRNDTAALGMVIVPIPGSTPTTYFTNAFDVDGIANDDYVPYGTISTNGAVNVLPNLILCATNDVTAATTPGITNFASEASGATDANGMGHHLGLAYISGNIYPVWPDNSVALGGNPNVPNTELDFGLGYSVLKTAHLGITLTESPYPPVSGEELTYNVIVTNYGPFQAVGVSITNQFSGNVTVVGQPTPASGGTYSILNNGQTVVFNFLTLAVNASITSTIRVSATQSGLVTNVANVYNTIPPSLAGNTVTNYSTNGAFTTSAANTVVTNVVTVSSEDLGVGITAFPSIADFGTPITYTVTVTNFGPAGNGVVYVTNALSANLTQINVLSEPQGTYSISGTNLIFSLGTLGDGQAVTLSYTAIPISVNNSTNATSSVLVASSDFDSNPTNNAASVVVGLAGEDLAVGLTASSANADIGSTITYTENITNLGPATNGVVNITNLFSDNLTNITIIEYPPYTNFTQGGQTTSSLFFTLGQMVSNQVITIKFTAVAKSVSASDTNGIVTASVSSANFDPNTNNNIAATLTTINAIVPTSTAISNLVVTPFATSAIISWSAPAPASVQVAYGLTTNYTSYTTWTPLTTNPIVVLSGLTPGLSYYFEIFSLETGNLYTTNGNFATMGTLILNTYNATYSGSWSEGSPSLPGIYGSYFNDTFTALSTPTASATYSPTILTPGNYNVDVWYPVATNFTTNAQVFVFGATNAILETLNQTANGGTWQPLATNIYFGEGTNGAVVLYNNTGNTNTLLAANAMRWTYVTAQDYASNVPPAWWSTYFFGTNTAAAASNYAAYVFGVIPGSPVTLPDYWITPPVSNMVTVSFAPYQSGRSYLLQTATSLINPQWVTLTNAPVETSTTNGAMGTFTIPAPANPNTFIRLSAGLIAQ